jgi:asparagine synthase (glutamine-hydrolysing)
MCGIAGILGGTADPHQRHALSQRMQAALHHRGPDDRGIYQASDRQATLIHTRLSILDLSAAGHQPMTTADGRYWITFNGEIYNFQQLRRDLVAQGHSFQSQTDTEVILKLYQTLGADCVKHLRGMFAFALWDDWEKTGFLARDPLGIKPLYFWQSGSTLLFASELKALLASGLPHRALDPAGLYGYLTTGSVPEPHTLIAGIRCLPAAHCLQWRGGQVHQSSYWHWQFGTAAPPPAEATATLRAALLDSVQHHFVSDVPVGVFLSGGIDSTAVLALARQSQTGPLKTYSIAFAEPAWDEGAIAQKVAQHFATEHTEYRISAMEGRSLLPQYFQSIDQPSVDGFNTFCVSHLAHRDGTKVVLSGLGGDELFNGYHSFQAVAKLVRWGRGLQAMGPLRTLVGAGVEQYSQDGRLRRLGQFLQQSPSPMNAYRCVRGVFSHGEACRIVETYLPDFRSHGQPDCGRALRAQELPTCPDLTDTVSWLEISHYMRNQLLRDSDRMSMAWGLELRVPLVDRVVLETIAPISSAIRLAPGKQWLTQAVPEIPSWVIERPKQGFTFPFQQWMQAEWQDLLPPTPPVPGLPLQSWYRQWSLMMLAHWWQEVGACVIR